MNKRCYTLDLALFKTATIKIILLQSIIIRDRARKKCVKKKEMGVWILNIKVMNEFCIFLSYKCDRVIFLHTKK